MHFELQVRQAVCAARALLSWQDNGRRGLTILLHDGPLEACFLILQAVTVLPGGKQELESNEILTVQVIVQAVTSGQLTSSAVCQMGSLLASKGVFVHHNE